MNKLGGYPNSTFDPVMKESILTFKFDDEQLQKNQKKKTRKQNKNATMSSSEAAQDNQHPNPPKPAHFGKH